MQLSENTRLLMRARDNVNSRFRATANRCYAGSGIPMHGDVSYLADLALIGGRMDKLIREDITAARARERRQIDMDMRLGSARNPDVEPEKTDDE